MFKNKKAIYILIPLNLFIWSFFAYRIYAAYTETEVPQIKELPLARSERLDNDTVKYNLSLDYKDPFLKDVKQTHENSNTVKAVAVKTVAIVKTPTVAPKALPDIKYLGLVKNNSNGVATAIISLNGQSKFIKANDVIDGITFKSFDKESLVAMVGKEKIVVRK
jgi:hypothetical protein